jgi:hypothetical protein
LRGAVHGEVSTIGLDIAKSVFQMHGVDDAGAVLIEKRVSGPKVLELLGGTGIEIIAEMINSLGEFNRSIRSISGCAGHSGSQVRALVRPPRILAVTKISGITAKSP